MFIKNMVLLVVMFFMFTSAGITKTPPPLERGSSFDAHLYSSSLALSKDMKLAVGTQTPYRNVHIYSLEGNIRHLGTINTLNFPRAVVFDEKHLNRFYVTDSAAGAIFIVEVKNRNYEITDRIDIEKGVFGMAMDPKRRRIFITNPTTGNVHVFDMDKKRIINSEGGFFGVQQAVTLNDDGSLLFLGSYTKKEIYILNARTLDIEKTVETLPGITSLALSMSGKRLYATSLTKDVVSIYSTATYNAVATLPTGGEPLDIAVPLDDLSIITSNMGDNTLTVVSATHLNIVRTIKLPYSITGAVAASRKRNSKDIVYALDKSMNLFVINWNRARVEQIIE